MKIAHVLWGFTPGGIENMLIDIVAEQSKTDEVHVFVINDKLDDSLLSRLDNRCRIHLFHRRAGGRNPMPVIRYNLELNRVSPDIIHFHYTALVKMTFCKAVKVITIHNSYSDPSDFDRYDAIFSISDAVADYIRSFGYSPITVTNGIPSGRIREKKEQYRAGNAVRLVQVGRLYHEHKGQHILIEALGLIIRKYGFSEFVLDFIGNGESENFLREMTDSLGLSEHVRFLGSRTRDYIYEHLSDYDFCVQPSLSEGFGLSVAEAMVAGVPVIVSKIPGTMEVIDGGRLGYSFESGNAESLAAVIMGLVSDPDRICHLYEARQYACEHFDVARTAASYNVEYSKLLKRKI